MTREILMDHAVKLMFEIYMLRGDCSAAARTLGTRAGNEAAIEDCAKLDDALARSYRALQHTLRSIQESRARRSKA